DVRLKDPKEWKIIGKSPKRLDTPEKVTGRAEFGIDVKMPGLLTAMVARSPAFGGKVKSFHAEAALAVPGVRKVVQVPRRVPLLADPTWAAEKGRGAPKVARELGA